MELNPAPFVRSTGHVLVRSVTLADAEGYRAAFDSVARERRHLGHLVGPSIEEARKTVAAAAERKHPFVVATQGGTVVGWCNALPYEQVGFRHAAPLHMGLVAGYRSQGLGARMLSLALDSAYLQGLRRIELEVYAGNGAALGLYKKHGFVQEGLKARLRYLDGHFEDVVCMGKWLG